MPDLTTLAARFRAAGLDHSVRSPFQAGLESAVAEDPELVALLQAAPDEQQLPVLLMAAVHSIVLAEPELPLARWYPTVSARPLPSDPFPAFQAFCRERADDLRAIIETRSTQTNEIGRCSLFVPALGLLAEEMGALGLVDVGTSGGLNLRLPRYGYDYRPGGVVDGDSDLTLTTATRGEVPVPSSMPPIAARLGIDRDPIDVSDPIEARWLKACVWPDQLDRFERLSAAIEIAVADPVAIMRADAVDGLADAIETVVGQGGHPVVLNSWVLNYLSDDRRADYVAELDRVGSTRDLSWVVLESPALCPGLPFPAAIADQHVSALMSVAWRNGERTVAHQADAHPHGYWLHWTSASQ